MAPALAYATAFGLALLQALVGLETQPTDTNALTSPLSGSAALTMALNAAGGRWRSWRCRPMPPAFHEPPLCTTRVLWRCPVSAAQVLTHAAAGCCCSFPGPSIDAVMVPHLSQLPLLRPSQHHPRRAAARPDPEPDPGRDRGRQGADRQR
jgi:hypothetical protein